MSHAVRLLSRSFPSFLARLRSLAAAALLLMAAAAPASAEVVADWLAAGPKALASSPRGLIGRASVLTNLAMFNALNAVTPRYVPYGAAIDPVPDASPDAAAATAAWVVLSGIPGADQALLSKTLEDSLKPVTDAAARAKGAALGRRVAYALLSARADDLLTRVEPAKREPAAGVYELTSDYKMESSVALGRTRPFAIASVMAYDPGPPPALDSAIARRDLAEVKALGARNSTTRTADQSVAAVFWNSGEDSDGLAFFQRIADARKLSSLDYARMMALSEMADFDGRIVYVAIKEKYRSWRPVNALRGKFADAALKDETWEPLLATPPNPDYPSGGAVGGGYFLVLLTTFNPGNVVPLSWKNTAIGVTRTWPNAEAMSQELAASRVWAGVHFRNSVDTGYAIGKRVTEEVFATQLRPLPAK